MKLPAIYWIDFATNFLPVGVGLYNRRWIVKENRLFFFFTIAALCSELITFTLAINGIRNLWMLQIYSLVSYTLLALLFAHWLQPDPISRLVRYSVLLYGIVWTGAKVFGIEGINDPAHFTHPIASTALVIISSITLYRISHNDTEPHWWNTMRFWVSSGVLLYFAGNVMLFVVLDKIASLRFSDAMTIWSFHWSIDAVTNISYTFGLLCLRQDR